MARLGSCPAGASAACVALCELCTGRCSCCNDNDLTLLLQPVSVFLGAGYGKMPKFRLDKQALEATTARQLKVGPLCLTIFLGCRLILTVELNLKFWNIITSEFWLLLE